MTRTSLLVFLCPLLAGLGLGGCEPKSSDRLLVHQQWNAPVVDLDLVPLLRFTEDMRVGDVLVLSPTSKQAALSGSRWTTLPVNDRLVEEYGARGAWPSTPPAYLTIDEDEASSLEPEIAGEPEIYAAGRPTQRLPILDLAMLSNVVISSGDVLRLVPAEVVGVLPAAATDNPRVLRVSIASAESYALSLRSLLPLALGASTEGSETRFQADAAEAELLMLMSQAEEAVELAVISEVIYVRAVDVVVQIQGDASADDPLYQAGLDAAQPEEGEAEPVEPGAAGEVPIDPIVAAYARARSINEVLVEGDLCDTPMGTLRVLNATEDTISVRRIFRHGVAVAVRGVLAKIDPATMRVIEIGPLR